MICRASEQQAAVAAVIFEKKLLHLELSTNEWMVVENIRETLKPFKTANAALSTDKYPTASAVLPLQHILINQVKNFASSEIPVIKEMKNKIYSDLSLRYDKEERQSTFMLLNKASGDSRNGEQATPGEAEPVTPGDGKRVTPGKAGPATPGDGKRVTPGNTEQVTPGNGKRETPGEAEPATPGDGEWATPGKAEPATSSKAEPATPGEAELATPGGSGRRPLSCGSSEPSGSEVWRGAPGHEGC
ncbi:UNVERIFIED_CONTAM: hypothetical protein FKN15_002559 [Acipenser sinensis]